MAAFPLPPRRNVIPKFTMEPEIALVEGHAAWWVPPVRAAAQNRKQKIYFAAALKDFLQHVSFHCYGMLVEPGRRFQERLFWFVFHVTTLTTLVVFLSNTMQGGNQLLATTIYNHLYPIQKVPFPTIAFCTTNRISNVSATRYATELNDKDPRKRGFKYFFDLIEWISYNSHGVDFTVNYDTAVEFQQFLDFYDTADQDVYFNTKKVMEMLSPKCTEILMKCRLAGRDINCWDEFVVGLTSRGFCCIFNQNGRYSTERSYKNRFFGIDMGLVVLLNVTTKDNYDKLRPNGVSILVYGNHNFPDIRSGSVKERFVSAGDDSFLTIKPRVLETVRNVRFLSPKTRNCIFEDEWPRVFGKKYTFNRCITRCRMHSILILCNCLMYMYPFEFFDPQTNTVYCTVRHIQCLQRYEFKWRNVVTRRENVRGLEREMEDALFCPDCLPTCSETFYSASLNTLPLNAYNMGNLRQPINGNATDLALLHISFEEPNAVYFRQILQNSWFELFSFVGNICSIITGFSLVGICEILYFLSKQLCIEFREEVLSDRKRKAKPKQELIILP